MADKLRDAARAALDWMVMHREKETATYTCTCARCVEMDGTIMALKEALAEPAPTPGLRERVEALERLPVNYWGPKPVSIDYVKLDDVRALLSSSPEEKDEGILPLRIDDGRVMLVDSISGGADSTDGVPNGLTLVIKTPGHPDKRIRYAPQPEADAAVVERVAQEIDKEICDYGNIPMITRWEEVSEKWKAGMREKARRILAIVKGEVR